MKIRAFILAISLTLAFVAGASFNNRAAASAQDYMVVSDGRFKFAAPGGVVRELRFDIRNEPGGSHLIRVKLFDEQGIERATPVRFKLSNGSWRLAADFPGCDPAYVVVDENGHIING